MGVGVGTGAGVGAARAQPTRDNIVTSAKDTATLGLREIFTLSSLAYSQLLDLPLSQRAFSSKLEFSLFSLWCHPPGYLFC